MIRGTDVITFCLLLSATSWALAEPGTLTARSEGTQQPPLPDTRDLIQGEKLTEPLRGECLHIEDDQARLACYDQQASQSQVDVTGTVLDSRIIQEEKSIDNNYSLLAHQPSYFMPFAYAHDPNDAPFDTLDPAAVGDDRLDHLEVKFQISFRVPLKRRFIFKNSDLWFGYTQLSLWQLYNRSASAPFRETNYEPELIWRFLVNRPFGDLKLTHLALALNHQSNGRSEPLSRSWNRIYLASIWTYRDWAFGFRPWYRLPESSNDDDNPDIEDYLGNFDFRLAYKDGEDTYSAMFRSNLDADNPHNFYELGYSFPFNRKVRGYIQFVNGYGESLIDYNYRTRRLSLGIMLNDWF